MNSLISLSKGDRKEFEVSPYPLWNHSGFQLNAGEVYSIEVRAGQWWVDFYIPTDANGYSSWFLRKYEKMRRVPDQNWFKLIGTIGENIHNPIIIGRQIEGFSSLETGELVCFANDMESMYWNNWKSITVTLTRTD